MGPRQLATEGKDNRTRSRCREGGSAHRFVLGVSGCQARSILSGMIRAIGPAAQRGALCAYLAFACSVGCSPEPQGQPGEQAVAGGVAASVELEIVDLIHAQWPRVAVERCRERIAADPQAPMPYALMALATWWEPNRAARCCWDAVQRREHGTAYEQQLVDALQDYFRVVDQPELVDDRFRAVPTPMSGARLARRLEGLAANAELSRGGHDRAPVSRVARVGEAPVGAAEASAGRQRRRAPGLAAALQRVSAAYRRHAV